MEKIKSNKIVISYFYLVTFTTIFYLTSLHLNLSNAMTEWLINYQGGFTRRGFFGEILFHAAVFFDLELKKTILFVQCSIYSVFFYYTYFLIKELEKYNLIFLSIFSAIFLFFPLAELEALGRKEVLVSILMLGLVLMKNQSFNFKMSYILVGGIFILLTHEIIVFHILYFIIFLIISNKSNYFSNNLKIFLFFIFFILCSWLLFKNVYTVEMKNEMCRSLKENLDVLCGFQTHYVANQVSTYMGEVGWGPMHYFRNFFIFLLGFGPLLILSLFSNFNTKNINPFFSKIPLCFLILVLIVPNLLIFFISVDTGRYFHLSYSMTFIFFFGLKFNDLIIINHKKLSHFEKKIFKNSKIFSFLIVFLVCFSWNPKATYREDLGSIPVYRTFQKLDIFIKTLRW
mgnify:CR=1 FL=1